MSTTSFDLGEPIICLNTSCNYPFGRICSECSNELESRAALKAHAQSLHRAVLQAQPQSQSKTSPDSDSPHRNAKVQPALSRRTTIQSRSHDISERVADIVEDLQGIFAFVPASSTAAVESAAAAIPAPVVPQKPRQILSPSSASDTFTGGAEESDKLDAMCPYCDASMGEGAWRELHLINCRYAHIEKERLEIAMRRGRGKRGD